MPIIYWPFMTRAISYLRFSSTAQALGQSEERQIKAAEDYCAKHGLTLLEGDKLSDMGLSAYRGANRTAGALGGFLEAVRTGRIPRGTYLIVEALDRLSREAPARALHTLTEIILAGIILVTLKDESVHDEASLNAQPYRLFHSLALIIAANAESALKSSRVSAAWSSKRRRASEGHHVLTPIRPAWVDLIDGKLVANPEGARTVRRIFEDVANGMGCFTVANRLQAEWVKTGAFPPLSGNRKTNGWNKSRVREIVQSDAPLGVLHAHKRAADGKTRIPGEKIEAYYPVIVSQSLANRARAAIASRRFGKVGAGRRGTVYSNLLSGIAKCSVCGGSMTIFRKSEEHYYLRCSNGMRGHACTNNSPIRYPSLEAALLRDVHWIVIMQSKMPKIDPGQEIAERIAEKVAEAGRLIQTISALTEAFGGNRLPAIADQIKSRAELHEVIVKEIEQLRQEHAAVERKANPINLDAEKDKLEAAMKSEDKSIRFEVRSRIASALRDTLQSVMCHADRKVDVRFPEIKLPKHANPVTGTHPVWGDRGVPESVYFGIKYDAKHFGRTVMTLIRPSQKTEEMDITGFAPSLLLSALFMDPNDHGKYPEAVAVFPGNLGFDKLAEDYIKLESERTRLVFKGGSMTERHARDPDRR
jgi:DNA invertase Pin-like site-specific DNA recombinase